MSISPGAWPTAVTANEDQAPSLNTSTWRMIAPEDERLRGCYVGESVSGDTYLTGLAAPLVRCLSGTRLPT